MARASRYNPLIGMLILGLGFLVGAGLVWTISPALFGSTKPKATAPAPTPKRPKADVARTVELVDQAVLARTAKTLVPAEPSPDAKADASGAVKADETAPVPPEQQEEVREYARIERPFVLRCPTTLNRYDRVGNKLEPVPLDPFCAGLKGHCTAVVFWRSDVEAALAALKLFQANAARLAEGTPPLSVVFVSADRFPSDLKAFYEAEGSEWTFDTLHAPVDGWLTNYGSQNPDRSFPWLVLVDPSRMVLFEGHAMQTPAELKGFEKLRNALSEARPASSRVEEPKPDEPKVADGNGAAKGTEGPRKDKLVDAAAKKTTPSNTAGASAGRREIDYVTLGLQVMRLFPELAGTPELRQVVKMAEGSLNARLKKMNPGEANRLVANLPDALVRDAVKAALKSIGK